MASTNLAQAHAPARAVDAHPMRKYANAIRALSMDAVEKANSGHPGMPMGMADVATVLFTKFMHFDPAAPTWPDRDRFILSAGHGSMLLYSLAYLLGYEKMTLAQIQQFRQLHSITPGHPEHDPAIGVETTTGPLGQGIANAVGFALAERITNARFGDELVNHFTYVVASDGDMMEGISHEACSLAGHMKLSRLIVLYDDNGISIDGPTSLSYTEDPTGRFTAYGWDVQTIDGHDFDAIEAAIAKAQKSDRPSLIRCQTTIGYGAPHKANTSGAHGSPLGEDEIKGARAALDWPYAPFEVPAEILTWWREAGARNAQMRKAWQVRHEKSGQRDAFDAAFNPDVSGRVRLVVDKLVQELLDKPVKNATRQASGETLNALIAAVPELVGGSADLTPSNNTYKKGTEVVKPGAYGGQYIHYGVREHGMAATMNGMALHGGVIPYAGTFLTFSDYCRPAIRMAALMKTRVIHVMTHDSIGLGEDGPTHQPVEHLAALRAIPNCFVMRPGDAVETAECWQVALERIDGPSVFALTRQALPTLRNAESWQVAATPTLPAKTHANLCGKGGYILRKNFDKGTPDLVLMASGSEVSIAYEAYEKLQSSSIKVQLVSVPCIELLEKQDEAYRREVIGPESARRIVVEAAIRQPWDKYLKPSDIFIGMKGFGESAPYQKLYEHFGITAAAIAGAAKR
ncbi:MAG: transketolase [Rhodospirillales bacterium]|nr:transketolase [Alphaproteobacteria bacterium]MCB9987408.1 transketolase [Rhodospirillales bacterium]USO07610.1 MAG: transketolase [Rhodospirillales bacterium]